MVRSAKSFLCFWGVFLNNTDLAELDPALPAPSLIRMQEWHNVEKIQRGGSKVPASQKAHHGGIPEGLHRPILTTSRDAQGEAAVDSGIMEPPGWNIQQVLAEFISPKQGIKVSQKG